MTRSAVNRFRTRKLSTKQTLQVLRESQIDSVDDDAQRNIPQIETGVERQEEIEHHLQAAINASHAAAVGAKDTKKIFIPTPNTAELPLQKYEHLYPKKFSQPTSYIRFSSTVEDCCATAYCMSEDDDKFLASVNQNKRPPITEDEFETVMDLLETTIQIRQPYLSMDPSFRISSWDEMESSFDPDIDSGLKAIAKMIYSYWKMQKEARGGKPIIPQLKFEQQSEKDDGDPYVCFRRREVRQVRKTRRTDAQSTDKLKRIRQELETARGLVKDVLQRETMRKNQFEYERQIFEKRRAIIELKRKLGIKGDDEDLINKPKRKPIDPSSAPTIRAPAHRDGKPPEQDLRQLQAVQAEEEKKRIEKFVGLRKSRLPAQFMDYTEEALFPSAPPPANPESVFCAVQTLYLPPTPPTSAESSPSSPPPPPPVSVSHASHASRSLSTYRRRVGRGGRQRLDRRDHRQHPYSRGDLSPRFVDRYKFDREESDDEYIVDPHSVEQIKFRARMLSPPPEPMQVAMTPMLNGTPQMRRAMFGSPIMGNGGVSPAFPMPAGLHNQILGQAGQVQQGQQSPPIPVVMVNGQTVQTTPQPTAPQQQQQQQPQQQQQQQQFMSTVR